jgi:tRNA nucleotidyltransferase (CCA-adding enzyme)
MPYFVGACVRDALLGEQFSDFDREVFGMKLDDIQKLFAPKFALEKTGKAFCVMPIDISIPRTERKIGDKHKDFHVNLLDECDIRTAASRRDFTINAIYFVVVNENSLDEFGGNKSSA